MPRASLRPDISKLKSPNDDSQSAAHEKEAANRGGLSDSDSVGYFQPACLLQASRSVLCDFSHVEMDFVSLLSIFSFMHVQ